jgi:hypothetical protein
MEIPSKSRIRASHVGAIVLSFLALGFGAAAFTISTDSKGSTVLADLLPHQLFVQGEEASPASDVTPEQISKYVKVYEMMRADRNLTVDQAAGKQGLSLDDFRDLESKIERDDLVRDRVRQELEQHAQKHSSTKPAESTIKGSSSGGGGASEQAAP